MSIGSEWNLDGNRMLAIPINGVDFISRYMKSPLALLMPTTTNFLMTFTVDLWVEK